MTDSGAPSQAREAPSSEGEASSVAGGGARGAGRSRRPLWFAVAGAAVLLATAYHYRDLLAWKLAHDVLTVPKGYEAAVLTPSRVGRLNLSRRPVFVVGRFLGQAPEREGHVGLILGSTQGSGEERAEAGEGTWRLLVYPNFRRGFPDPFDPEAFEPGELLVSLGRFAPPEGGTILLMSNITYVEGSM